MEPGETGSSTEQHPGCGRATSAAQDRFLSSTAKRKSTNMTIVQISISLQAITL